MEENTAVDTATVDAEEQTSSDAFMDGWNDEDTVVEQEETPAEETVEDDEQEAETAEQTEAENEPAEEQTSSTENENEEAAQIEEPKADEPKAFVLRYMGEEKTVNEQELIALAQKGMDYDRIREVHDKNKPVVDLMNQFATKAEMSLEDYVSFIRKQAKIAEGMSAENAEREINVENREAAIAEKEAEEAEKAAAEQRRQSEKDSEADRRNADITAFIKEYPEAAKDAKSIPAEVWNEVNKGSTLVGAYSRYLVRQAKGEVSNAKKQLEAEKKNVGNASRGTGSMTTAGESSKSHDPFLEGWNNV